MRALPLESKYPHHAEHAYVSLATAVALVTPPEVGTIQSLCSKDS